MKRKRECVCISVAEFHINLCVRALRLFVSGFRSVCLSVCVGVRLNSSSGPQLGRQAGEEVGARTRLLLGRGEDQHALLSDGSGQARWTRL